MRFHNYPYKISYKYGGNNYPTKHKIDNLFKVLYLLDIVKYK
jgi:hypothetical protein